MTIQASQTTLKLLPPAPAPVPLPTSIVCNTCKEETGITPENIMEQAIDTHICCPVCGHVIYSCLPEKPLYTSGSHTTIYHEYD